MQHTEERMPFVDIELAATGGGGGGGGGAPDAEVGDRGEGGGEGAPEGLESMPNTAPLHDAYHFVTRHFVHHPAARLEMCALARLRTLGVCLGGVLGAHCSCWHALSLGVIGSGFGYIIGRVGVAGQTVGDALTP
jgi:hypothetical protein